MGNSKKIGYLIAAASILLNFVLFVVKYYVGFKAGSIAVQADAWHSLSDTLTSFVVIIGFWLASKPPDSEHPYGHGRAETIAAVVIATLLGVVAFDILYESFSRINTGTNVVYNDIVLYTLIFSVISKEIAAQISIRTGKKIKSETLIADGWHHRTDSLSSVIIIIGVLLNFFWWIDSVLGIVVSIFIFYATYEILKNASNSMLGAVPDDDLIKSVNKIISKIDSRIYDVHNFKLHSYGDHKELTLDFRLPSEMSVEESHEIANNAENAVLDELSIRTSIHIEPALENHDGNSDISDHVDSKSFSS